VVKSWSLLLLERVGMIKLCHNMGRKSSRDPLIKAAKRGDLIALKDAICSGAVLNGTDSQGWTPLFHAASIGWTEGLRIIIEAGADVNHGKESGFTALLATVLSGHIKAVQVLLEAGAQVRDLQCIKLSRYVEGKKRAQMIAALKRAGLGNSNAN
jgi:ankyrin repeat protein